MEKIRLEPIDQEQQPKSTKYMQAIGNSFVFSYDKTFFEGFECGYNEHLTAYKGQALSDQDIYKVIMKVVEVTKSGRYQAGFVTGWMAALFESIPGTTDCEVTTIPFVSVI